MSEGKMEGRIEAEKAARKFTHDNVIYADEEGRLEDLLEGCDPETGSAATCDGCQDNTQAVYVAFYQGFMRGRAQWIPVSERLPEPETDVLVVFEDNGRTLYEIASWYGDALDPRSSYWAGMSDIYGALNVTHWMPLPEGPEGEE